MEKNLQSIIHYAARLSFRIEGEIKIFPDKQRLVEFMTTKPSKQEILKESLSVKRRNYSNNMMVGNTKAVKINIFVKISVKELTK